MVRLHVVEAGSPSGQPTLLMHGGLGLDHSYLRVFDRLGDRARLIYYDHRSNGRSEVTPSDGVTMSTLADDAEELRQSMALGPVDVIGHSYGGFVALQFALDHPSSVRRLVLVDTIPGMTPARWEQVMERVQARNPTPEIMAALSSSPADVAEGRQMLERILPLYFVGDVPPEMQAGLDAMVLTREGAELGDQCAEGWDLTDRLGEVTAPTLVLCGRHDWVCPSPQSEILAAGIPGAELVVFEDCGHFPWLEAPDEFWPAVERFLYS